MLLNWKEKQANLIMKNNRYYRNRIVDEKLLKAEKYLPEFRVGINLTTAVTGKYEM